MSKKRLPVSVLKARGKTNLTKAEIKKREQQEKRIRGNTDNIEPPSRFSKEDKAEFNRISSQLVELGIFSNLDVDLLVMFIDSKREHEKVTNAINNMKPVETTEEFKQANEMYLKLVRIKKSLFDECRSVANDLGLTITSRLKLVIPEPEKEEKSEFEKKFSNV